ncbi:MAG: DUF2207 domain-containing protein [Candidatus Omnitrophota bacterium]
MKRIQALIFLSVLLFFSFSLFLYAEGPRETILSFHSLIKINTDSSMVVTETIKVFCAQKEIKQGIYRDFPTRYRDRLGNRYSVQFDVMEVLRDGQAEQYHLKDRENGVRVYLGKEGVFLAPGEYTYTLRYKTNRQLGFFKDFDELYWNVTGNGWVFSIEQASAIVVLPAGAGLHVLDTDAYTGPKGSKEKSFSVSQDAQGDICFLTTRPLASYEGLTIVVSWPKGYVIEPDLEKKAMFFIYDHKGAFIGIVGVLLLFFYYLFAWAQFGRDPAKGTIIPLYSPPQGFTSISSRYIARMGYDDKVFVAGIIEMAVKGYLVIHEESSGYILKKTGIKDAVLSNEERAIANNLFSVSDQIELTSVNHLKIKAAKTQLQTSLRNSLEKIYFFTNKKYFISGAIFSVVIIALSAVLEAGSKFPIVLFMSVWLTIWSLGTIALFMNVTSLWKVALGGSERKGLSFSAAIGMTFFSLPFFAGEIFGVSVLVGATSWVVLVVLILIIFLDALFYHLLKRPTFAGRKIMDQLEGFKMFLSVTEKDRLKHLTSFEKTPELFEKYLPYALALDVEEAWVKQFSDVFKRAQMGGKPYHPSWYQGAAIGSVGIVGFTGSLGSTFSGVISSSSNAPGSSSGGGGGGSSGGGGGGGGGGGW